MMTASSKTSDGFVINHSLPNFPRLERKKLNWDFPRQALTMHNTFFACRWTSGK